MRCVEFRAGYWEWVVFVDGVRVYAFSDPVEWVVEAGRQWLPFVVGDAVAAMCEELEEEGEEELSPAECDELARLMVAAFVRCYL